MRGFRLQLALKCLTYVFEPYVSVGNILTESTERKRQRQKKQKNKKTGKIDD